MIWRAARREGPRLAQFAVSAAIGCWIFLELTPDPNPKVPLIGGLLGGFFGGWAVMYLYVLCRYGWWSARSLTMEMDR